MVKKQPKGTGGEMTVVEAAARGGSKTVSGHDHNFFKEIGKQGGLERAKQRVGSKEAEDKASIEEALNRGRLIELGKKHEKE